tara:strand:- start:193 stop:918 length:726 start_codon:yes stop_codon:yes gene_type:complete
MFRMTAASLDTQPLVHSYGLCERVSPDWFAEPLNVISNLGFLIVACLIYREYKSHPDLRGQWIWDVRALTFLIFFIGISSITFHSFPSRLTEMMDVIPIVTFIILFFLSIIVRIGKTNWFQTLICFLAFLGTTHMLVTQFPNAMNDSIGYLSSMMALIMIAVHLHISRRPSSHQFLLAALVGVVSLFFRAVDNDVCEQWPFGTHFLWHTLNAVLLFILMKQVIRNVNREARIERMKRAGLT